MKNLLAIGSLFIAANAVAESECPTLFFNLPLYPQANYCQQFNDAPPATLTYHANAGMQQTAEYYQKQLGKPGSDSMFKGRRVMQFDQGNTIIVLSVDGNGTQVDILVKTA
ncbi:hypothetical protein [Neptunicella marina]|uniref:Uncharacterized protein n=1 Tax=Neptunicella marina TaxID=2125989 RepID=A0A8J6IT07_9ALTE|nr:hypothetical protein [Neptunicella marina]MBC3765192.1 hypothetical protein [Neptunicella marina]